MGNKKTFNTIEEHYEVAALLKIADASLRKASRLMSDRMTFGNKYFKKVAAFVWDMQEIQSEMDRLLFAKFTNCGVDVEDMRHIYYGKFVNPNVKAEAIKFLKEEGLIE